MYQKNFAQKNATDIILQLQEKLNVKDAEILSLKVQIEDLKAQKYAALKIPLELKKEKIECELELVKAYDRIDSLQQTLQRVNEQSEKESRRATELAQSVENLERQLAARNDTTKLWLPQKVPAEEVQVVEIYSQDFMWITEKVKKIVIDVLGSVERIRNDARDPLVSAVQQLTGKQVNIFTYEDGSLMNSHLTHPSSALYLQVRGLAIIFFTQHVEVALQ